MLRSFQYLVVIAIFCAVFASVAEGADMSDSDATQAAVPNLVMQQKTTDGILGAFLRYLRPFTKVFLQFINSALIRTRKEQLPCTIFNLARFDYKCTPVVVAASTST